MIEMDMQFYNNWILTGMLQKMLYRNLKNMQDSAPVLRFHSR